MEKYQTCQWYMGMCYVQRCCPHCGIILTLKTSFDLDSININSSYALALVVVLLCHIYYTASEGERVE